MLKPRQRLWYGVGQIAEGIKNHSFTAFLLFYYTQVLGLSGTLAGLALAIALAFDAVSDPLAGVLSDRTDSRWGRRHPWMYASAVPLGIAFFLVFAPPQGLSERGLFLWLVTFTVASRAAMTLYHVPHMALGAELSQDYRERTRIVMSRALFGAAGTYLAGGFGLLYYMRPTAEFPDGQLNPAAYPAFAVVFALVMVVTIVASGIGTHGTIAWLPRPDAVSRSQHVLRSLVRDSRAVLRIPSFRALFLGSTLIFVSFGVAGVLGLHLGTYFWHVSTREMFYAGVGAGLGTFSGMLFWARVADRFDKKPTFILGLSLFVVFAAGPLLCKALGFWPGEDHPLYLSLYIAPGVLYSFSIAAATVTGTSMMADVTDQDELESGRSREGVFFGASAFAAKAAVAGGQLIAGPILDMAGIVKGLEPESVPVAAGNTLAFAAGIALLVLVTLALLVFSRYELDRDSHAAIRRALDARARAERG